MANRPTTPEIFWMRVIKTPTCWLYQRGAQSCGHCRVSFMGRRMLAHRVSYMLHYGAFDETLDICHKCDVPNCVNPAHLFIGTHADNMTDKTRKGRAAKKLTAAIVLDIRKRVQHGETHRAIAAQLGVSHRTVGNAASRLSWGHVQ